MPQTIHLAAILAREGRLFLTRPDPDGMWDLPGGPFEPHVEDVDAGMTMVLRDLGVHAEDLATDFVETLYLPGPRGHVVYNIYAPSAWRGEPATPAGAGAGWFPLDELEAVPMDDRVRRTVQVTFGFAAPVDESAAIIAALDQAFGDGATASAAASPNTINHDAVAIAVLAALGRRLDFRDSLAEALDNGLTTAQLMATLEVVNGLCGKRPVVEIAEFVVAALRQRAMEIPEDLL